MLLLQYDRITTTAFGNITLHRFMILNSTRVSSKTVQFLSSLQLRDRSKSVTVAETTEHPLHVLIAHTNHEKKRAEKNRILYCNSH